MGLLTVIDAFISSPGDCGMRYHNDARTHLSLNKDTPIPRNIQRVGQIFAKPHLCGLHHQYVRI